MSDEPGQDREYRVAMVVFLTATGGDEADAQAHAQIALSRLLRDNTTDDDELPPVLFRGKPLSPVRSVSRVMELGMAVGNGYAWVKPTIKAYREAGS